MTCAEKSPFTSWDDFNTHRYCIGGGNVVAPIGTPTQMDKFDNGSFVIQLAGVYKVSVTKDMVITITKTGDVVGVVSKVQVCGATDSEWTNRIDFDLTKGEDGAYTGVLDPAGSTNRPRSEKAVGSDRDGSQNHSQTFGSKAAGRISEK